MLVCKFFYRLGEENILNAPSDICNYGSSASSQSSLDSEFDHDQRDFAEAPTPEITIVTSPSSSNVNGYEEFFGGTRVCPTCNGKGRISRGKY